MTSHNSQPKTMEIGIVCCMSEGTTFTNQRKGVCSICGKSGYTGDVELKNVDIEDVLGQGRR